MRVRIHLHDAGHGWRQVSLSGVTIAPSRVDLLPGGEFLLVQSRCTRQPHEIAQDNAQVFDTSGQPVRSFRLGDGISHLAIDEPGTIWVGYFDEGVYGGDPLSAAGAARFDEYGRRLWSYWPPPGFDHIADCYALNVDARTTWAYYYTGFPLIRITDTEVRPFRPGPVRGARAVLVYDDEAVLIGEYGNPYRLTECRLLDDTIAGHGPVVLTDPAGLPLEKFRLVSTCGSRLIVRTTRHIFEADLADLAPTDRLVGPAVAGQRPTGNQRSPENSKPRSR
ncbi:hypothetical protein [Plantactinospora sp. KLBMP9567]|uniref:hypothetical protein n=1 Tax=Plantactinospora sp. KLBMP9567 TaxID=3085900 RepID=UPI002981A123|nr:hypothetical protein [Plantactinospora sp. KLBMP9567]MDW5326769.1 hypothetical protein [Plantactinospora sp. KLBMP9567]